jgi:predicted HTH domain antitoxin
MNISFEIPRDIGEQIRTDGADLSGKAREAFLVELYREHKISHRQLGEALGLEQYETDGLLKKHGVYLGVSVEELRAEASALRDVRPE